MVIAVSGSALGNAELVLNDLLGGISGRPGGGRDAIFLRMGVDSLVVIVVYLLGVAVLFDVR